jgi:RHS repeat-associated protein
MFIYRAADTERSPGSLDSPCEVAMRDDDDRSGSSSSPVGAGASARASSGVGSGPPTRGKDSERSERAPSTQAARPADPPAPARDDGPPRVQLAPSVALPKGGGALRSIGETFQPAPFTGTGTLSVPLPTSPGRQGFGPGLSLSYSSGGGNGPWGLGWDVSVPSITRKTDKGLPLYEDGRESDEFVLSGAEELVPVLEGDSGWGEMLWGDAWGALNEYGGRVTLFKDGHRVHRYRPRTEGLFARIEKWIDQEDGAIHWRATTKDNVTSIYGLTAAARIADPAHPERVFSWLLEESRDDRGNFIIYEYKQEDLADVDVHAPEEHDRLATQPSQAQRYLKRVRYGNREPGTAADFLFEVVLDYGEHGTWDVPSGELDVSPDEDREWTTRLDTFSSHRAGFDVRTRRLCRRVLMFHHFDELSPSPPQATLVASTDLDYAEGPAFTYLVGVTQRGYVRNDATGRYVAKSIPTLELQYSEPEIQDEVVEIPMKDLENMPVGIDGATYRLEDLDGEGVPGVLTEQGGQLWFKRGNGDGGFGPMFAVKQVPSSASLQAGAQLLDLGGDGVKDLVVFTRPTPGYYERTSTEGWEPFRAFNTVPNVDMNEPGLQLIDISGDGFPDILVDRGEHFLWWRSRAREGFDGPRIVPKPKDERRGATTLVYGDARQSILMTDMTGDGLPDIVRLRNGDVCYWPSLGHGRFGARIVMRDAPLFDVPDQFRPDRVRTADIDGTGTTDLVYLGRAGTKVWFNQAGNAFGPEQAIAVFPEVGSLDSVQVLDLKGSGTACLVWSTPRLDGRAGRLRYVDLMGPTKPHLLVASINNMGRETRVQYAPSTRFYIEDRDAGRPWITRLPFPVQVLERVETYDRIAKTKLVNHFRYHHGYYDGHEREFRGFAMVEQWDTESFDDFGGSGLFTFDDLETVEPNLHQPPVYTKTWFHTGAWIGRGKVSQQLAQEYWSEDTTAVYVPDTVVPSGLGAEDEREVCRALRGKALRQEVYALDGSEVEGVPYVVTERNFTAVAIQRKRTGRHAVVFCHDRESIAYNYERETSDPRIAHALVLQVDAYGNPTRTAQVAYPRVGTLSTEPQGRGSIALSQTDYAALDAGSDDYRVGVPYQARAWELTGVTIVASTPLSFETLVDAFDESVEIAFETAPTTGLQRRLLSATRTFFYEDDLSGVAPLGTAGIRGLVHEQRAAAFTPALLDDVYSTDVDTNLLQDEGSYVLEDGLWWTRSGRPVYDDAHFWLATQGIDPWGQTHTTTYDDYDLLPVSVVDPLGNTVTVDNDYRVLAPWRITDPNENRSAVEFDELGVPVRTALMGKDGASEGDTLEDPTTQLDYDLFVYQNSGLPNVIHEEAREQHGAGNPRWREGYTYFDGMGRVAMVKVQAEPGLAPLRDGDGDLVLSGSPPAPVLANTSPDERWVGTGRTVFDNKGNPVKQYEPYFSSIPGFETEDELVEQGVTPILHYDPLGRLVRVDLPNGTFSRTELTAWRVTTHDPNDTVLESTWHQDRIGYSGSEEALLAERRAAEITEAHANTPTTVHLDPQGRAYLTLEHAGFDELSPSTPILFETELELDVLGNVLSVTDARGNEAEARTYGMLKQVLQSTSVDAGMRRALTDVAGAPLRSWNTRGFQSRLVYDELRRPTHHFVTEQSASEMLVTRTLWGEEVTDPEDDNLRTRPYRVYDGSGVLTNDAYDFKGHLLQQTRRLATEYETTQDWLLLEDASPQTVGNIATAAESELESETFTFEMEYDALGRVTSRTTPDDSETLPTYNEAGLLEAVDVHVRGAGTPTTFVSNLDYNARGQRERCEHGNGTVTTYEYDPQTFRLRRMRVVRDSDSAVLQDLRYTHDPVGNIVEIRDRATQTLYFDHSVSPDQQFVYDPLYRLIEASGREHISQGQPTHSELTPGPQPETSDPTALRRYLETYTYDPVGNILFLEHDALSSPSASWTRGYDYADDGNRLLATSLPGEDAMSPAMYSGVYEYDGHGNMTAMPHLEAIDWDHADRMQHTDLGGGGDVWFVYDAQGSRVRKVWVNDGGTLVRERIYLGDWEVWRERSGAQMDVQQERETLHVADDTGRICLVETLTVDGGTPVATPANVGRYQYGNHLGTVALELDDGAEVISYEEFHPYGSSAYRAADSSVEVSAKRYRYTGKERDEETGLDHMGARYYAGWLGRWTSADPIGLGDGVNRYAYVSGNPVGMRDPSGTVGEPGTTSVQDQWKTTGPGWEVASEYWVGEREHAGDNIPAPYQEPEGNVVVGTGYHEAEAARAEVRIAAEKKAAQMAAAAARTEATLAKIHAEAEEAQRQGESDRQTAVAIGTGLGIAVAAGTGFFLGPAAFALAGKFGLSGTTAAVVAGTGAGVFEGGVASAVTEKVVTGEVTAGNVATGAALGGAFGGLFAWARVGLFGPRSAAEGGAAPTTAAEGGVETTRVGRWMSPDELKAMQETGFVQEGSGGLHRVAVPADSTAYRAAPSGDVFVTYDVPTSSLKSAGQANWRAIPGPSSPHARLAAKKGEPPPQLPRFQNLRVEDTK